MLFAAWSRDPDRGPSCSDGGHGFGNVVLPLRLHSGIIVSEEVSRWLLLG